MVNRNVRNLMPAFAGLVIALASLSLSKNPAGAFWRQHPRKIVTGEALSKPEREPVVITDIKVGPKAVNLNTPFDDQDEWIKDLSFKVKNHSSMTVTYVGVEMFFSDTSNSGPAMVRQLRFGQRTDHPDPANAQISLKPGAAIDVSIPTQYESLKKFLEVRQPVTSFNSVMIRVYLVFFEDGTKWDSGNFYIPDTTRPSGFRMVDAPTGIIRNDQY